MDYLSSLADPRNAKNCCVDWSSVPEDLVSIIANKLIHIKDYTVFGAVCTSWQSIYARNRDNLPREALLLMLPTEDDKDGKTRSLYSLYEKKIYDNLKITLPHNLHCCGSSLGWLATVSETYQVSLINPFLPPDNEIQLPPLTTFDRHPTKEPICNQTFLKKVVLSADPISNPNYMVMAIHSVRGRISFFKPGDKAWTPLDFEGICDVIYDQDEFYALQTEGHILVCDLNGPSPNIRSIGKAKKIYGDKKYLVKSSIGLLQVRREIEYDSDDDSEEWDPETLTNDYPTTFEVFNYDPIMDNWEAVNSLDGRVLFVGDNSSLCLSISDMPGCKPNCIYFTDDYHARYFGHDSLGPSDVGVFDLEDWSNEAMYPTDSKTFVLAPIFIQPTTIHLQC
ncbi:hypothetical protein ACHQM5_028803 [Ranunculus cassubicifolius]